VTLQVLLLIRHGVTDWNREGRFQGRLDPPLTDGGRTEARLLATRIGADPGLRPTRVVSSPLSRAAKTASALVDALGDGTAVVTDARLMEIGQGDWEGRTHRELAAVDPSAYAAWRASQDRVPPGGEPIGDAFMRIVASLTEHLGSGGWPLAIVSHGGTLRLAARHLLGLALDQAWALDLDNASLSVLSRPTSDTTWRIERWNDAAHLLGRTPLHVDEAEGEPLAL
jgi:broad specificity phosphatase PhoE